MTKKINNMTTLQILKDIKPIKGNDAKKREKSKSHSKWCEKAIVGALSIAIKKLTA